MFPAAWLRDVVRDRLDIDADEIGGGHMPMLARPAELAARLAAYAEGSERPTRRARAI